MDTKGTHSAFIRGVDTLPTPAPTITVYKDTPKIKNLRRGLSVEDEALVNRLNKLKAERKNMNNIPSESEMAERLAKLKGMNPSDEEANGGRGFHVPPDKRSNVEKSHDLMDQMADEIKIDRLRPKPEDEIEARLARLRGQEPPTKVDNNLNIDPSTIVKHSDETIADELSNLDDINKLIRELSKEANDEAMAAQKELEKDSEIKKKLDEIKRQRSKRENKDESDDENDDRMEEEKILESILAEANLEEKLPPLMSESTKRQIKKSIGDNDDDEELPWCGICNEDAVLRCKGCDGDLFCSRCFKECHDEYDIKDHKTQKYCAPPKE